MRKLEAGVAAYNARESIAKGVKKESG